MIHVPLHQTAKYISLNCLPFGNT